ncbi:MAG: hypothetical protein ACJ77B_06070 [Chloroflexota bacterium]
MRRSFALLLVAVLAGCAPAIPSAAPHRTPSATASAPGASAWEPVTLPAPAGATVRLGDIGVSGTSVVVVGAAEGAPTAWTLDGSGTWNQEPLEGQMTLPYALAAVGGRLIAIGEEQGQGCAHPGNEVVWVRDVTATWARTPFQPIFCQSGAARAVAADAKRVVVTGSNAGDRGFSMASADGTTWRGADLPVDDWPVAVAAGADGFVAVGRRLDGAGSWYGRSDDGVRWNIGSLGDGTSLEPIAVAVVGGVTVAWLTAANGGVEVAASRDLSSWTVTPVTDLDGVANVSIEAEHRPFLASGGEPGSGRAFVSNDGLSWTEIEVPHNGATRARLGHLVVVGDRVYVIASIPTPDDEVQVLVSAPVSVLGG